MNRRTMFAALPALIAAPAIARPAPRLYGNGVHDDTAAIQHLLDTEETKILDMPKGRYLINGVLRVPTFFCLGFGGSELLPTIPQMDWYDSFQLLPSHASFTYCNCTFTRNRGGGKFEKVTMLIYSASLPNWWIREMGEEAAAPSIKKLKSMKGWGWA